MISAPVFENGNYVICGGVEEVSGILIYVYEKTDDPGGKGRCRRGRNADYIIDMGPGGGEDGGRIIACGSPEEVEKCEDSITGRFIFSGSYPY